MRSELSSGGPRIGCVSEDCHLVAVPDRSLRTTDPVALNLFRQLRKMSEVDCQFVLAALESRLVGASSERMELARSAIALFSNETGEPLSKKRYERWRVQRPDSEGLPSATFIVNTWQGSWLHAMSQLGLQASADHGARRLAMAGPPRSDEELLEHLRECATAFGRTPLQREYDDWRRQQLRGGVGGVRYMATGTYRKRFGSWPRAIIAAGLPYDRSVLARPRVTGWTGDDAEQLLRQAAQERTPLPTSGAIICRYRGWINALVAAGLMSAAAGENLRIGAGKPFSDTQMHEAVAQFARETTGSGSSRAYELWRREKMTRNPEIHLPSRTGIALRAGGWSNLTPRIQAHRAASPIRS
jgi:hypothetical protein